ncbi:FmdB family zinc ribbon protein [Natranaerobius trueperi]|uniref:FmdB family transcriptional regulator n=1 Tax=Natranaerobius trueperi TaxID=759412 RepID=A0A226BZD1_9FIRM|nr:zinc ribbon domain-containing protein [Natranaerobius trueperi]OWZ84408.1 FmdB family transcriptional regulator [Natranaerobius trueperi]
MPNYYFRCRSCDNTFTKRVSYENKGQVTCPNCEGETKQIFTSVKLGNIGDIQSCCGGGCSGSKGCC